MGVRSAARAVAAGPARAAYAASAPVLRWLCERRAGRAGVETLMRGSGRALLWAFDAQRQPDAAAASREWQRVLRGLGLEPEASGSACTTCFARCTLALGPGDERTCDAVMSINDEMLVRLGGRMILRERLTTPGSSRCVVEVAEPSAPAPPSERALWCDDATAATHFDTAAGFYDFIMGYFEQPSNRRAVRHLRVPAGARVLELGVGTGLGLRTLLRHLPGDARVTAVDRSARMLERAAARIARARLTERVDFLRADAAATGLADASMDAAYSSFLLDLHAPARREAILAEARRTLRPGATAVFVVMDGAPAAAHDRALTGLYNAGYGRWNPVWQALFAGYAPHCRPVHLQDTLERSGFRVVTRDRAHVALFPVAVFVTQMS